ncbi:MAG TPA: hypothetical protein VN704_13720 [Verrucomicrobiae bacterium]|nr:hypothetical protein [Verrucomicrobiae bacterium]
MTKYFGDKFYDDLMNLCKNLSMPLDMGEPELVFMKEWSKPVYKEFTGKDYYDYYASAGIKSPRKMGDSNVGYSRNFNDDSISIVVEIPYIYDKKIDYTRWTKKTRRKHDN